MVKQHSICLTMFHVIIPNIDTLNYMIVSHWSNICIPFISYEEFQNIFI